MADDIKKDQLNENDLGKVAGGQGGGKGGTGTTGKCALCGSQGAYAPYSNVCMPCAKNNGFPWPPGQGFYPPPGHQ